MARKISVRPVEELIFEFADGTTKTFKLTMKAILLLAEEGDDIVALLKNAKENIYGVLGKLLYAGLKVNDSEMTHETAQSILECLDATAIFELIDVVNESLAPSNDIEKKMKAAMQSSMTVLV